eukprot:scaffold23000_cov63-Phaeocystis_antarctica.AAC.4
MIDLKLESQHDEGTRSGSTNLSKMTPGGQLQKSGGGAALPDGAEPERLNIKNSVQTNGDSLDYDSGRGHKVARVCCHLRRHAMLCYAMLCYAMLCYAMLCYPILSYPILSYPILSASYIRRHHPIQRLPCTTSQR